MVEVLFGESEAGSMKAAKSGDTRSQKRSRNGPTAVIGKKQNEKENAFFWIPGSASEVICLGFMLDVGDVIEQIDSEYRKQLLYSMYAQEPWGKDEAIDAELKALGEVYANEQKRLNAFLAQGETIRIWYSHSPYALCGFYQVCALLKDYDNTVYAVKLPEYEMHEDVIQMYSGWGEVSAEEFAGFLQYEKLLAKNEIKMYAHLWAELVEDNSPLRAVLNGRVVGVPTDFYDFLIWNHLTDTPVKEARLIGDILGTYRLGIGDWWYAARIEYFIKMGRIRVLEDSENKYARMICRV